MNEAGFDVTPVEMDLSSRESIQALIAEGQKYGEIKMLVNAAGVSPSQAPIEAILKVDLYGTAVLSEEVGKVIAPGGVGGRMGQARRAPERHRPRHHRHAAGARRVQRPAQRLLQ